MQLTIDRNTRWALYDAARCDIEGCSDLKIDSDDRGGWERRKVRDLGKRLRLLGPLLDQIGWEPDDDRDFFEIRFNVRPMQRLLRRHADMMKGVFEDAPVTETQLREETAICDQHTGKTTTEEQFAEELAEMRARVDRDLEQLAAYRRLLDVVTMPEPQLKAVA